jgi:hypothetical protein
MGQHRQTTHFSGSALPARRGIQRSHAARQDAKRSALKVAGLDVRTTVGALL